MARSLNIHASSGEQVQNAGSRPARGWAQFAPALEDGSGANRAAKATRSGELR